MVRATITNCTAFRMAVSRDRWCSMAVTKVSMRATKASACCAEQIGTRRGQGGPGGLERGPVALHGGKGLLRHVVMRHQQRARRVAGAQHAHALVELRQQPCHLLRVRAGQRLRHAPGLHAHAAGLVDGRRAAFQLPGHPQGQADRGQRHQQQGAADGAQLGGQAPGARHARTVLEAWPDRPGATTEAVPQPPCAIHPCSKPSGWCASATDAMNR
jgi:hypothetical protein